jgi:hypothetical protein
MVPGIGGIMSLLWLFACVYLLFSIVGVVEADIRVKPGASPSAVLVAVSTLVFALTHPATATLRWLAERMPTKT